MHIDKQVESLTLLFFWILDVKVLNLTSFSSLILTYVSFVLLNRGIWLVDDFKMETKKIAGWWIQVKPSSRRSDLGDCLAHW